MDFDGYKSGFLIYKCRRCGELDRSTHIPHGADLINIVNGLPLDKHAYPFKPEMVDTHLCKDGHLGVSDLIGFEYDRK